MKAIAWVTLALFQVTFSRFDFLHGIQDFSNLCHSWAVNFIESHPSRWNWFYEGVLTGADEGFRSRAGIQSFFTLGLYHLIVGAGGHVLALEKLMNFLTGFIPKKSRQLLTGLTLAGFALINGLQASCVRAVLQWVLTRGRRLSTVTGADLQILVTCLCLIIEPGWALSLSFQLSCAATLGLAIAASLFSRDRGRPRRKLLEAFTSSFLCTTVTAPLIFCIQPCLSWIIIPANTVAMPFFGCVLMPLSIFNIIFHRLRFITEWVFEGVFSVAKLASRFEHPLLCMDERKIRIWGLFYIAGLYLCWRFFLPLVIQRRFWTAQRKQDLKSFSGT